MSAESSSADGLVDRIHNLVRGYVYQRTEKKSGIPYDSFKNKKRVVDGKERMDVPQGYREAREKVCSNAFLRLRASRSREDFVAYFTGTICSVPQFLPKDDFIELSRALLDGDRWEDARALAMLALSSLSRIGSLPSNDTKESTS